MDDGLVPGIFMGCFLGMVTTIIFIGLVIDPHGIGYKQGQIDALTGKVQYELVTHQDKTATWEKKKESK